MLKYSLAAFTLKLFSINRLTRKAYRLLGNSLGAKRRKHKSIDSYMERGKLLLDLIEKHHAVKEHDQCLEIGTGWMHWFSLYVRLFHDMKIIMMDVWDNRQLEALKASFTRVSDCSSNLSERLNPNVLGSIVNAVSLDELYDQLNLNYVVDPRGTLDRFPSNTFDFVFSLHVLEHVRKKDIHALAANMYRILKPGGFSIHQIGIGDHLSHFDKKESQMNYLRYSDAVWKIFFQDDVIHFNRLLMKDWLDIFSRQGFVLSEKIPMFANIDSLKIHPQYKDYSQDDLSCVNLTIVHYKPKSILP